MKYQIPDWMGDNWRDVVGGCPETIAKAIAEQYLHDSAEYGVVDTGDRIHVRVEDDGGMITDWCVRVESILSFYAEAGQAP